MYYSKYRAKKVELDGRKFDSKKEAQRYCELKLLERAGEIRELKCQVPFTLIPKSEWGREIRYYADFTYYDKNDNYIVEDVKGVKTDVYRLKKRLCDELGVHIREV